MDRGFDLVKPDPQTWQTWTSARYVERAARAFALANDGYYASDSGDRNNLGMTMVDYLPGGLLMENAFTEQRSEPVNAAAAYQGQIGYLAIFDNGYPVGYVISAMGSTQDLVIFIEQLPD